MFKYTRKKTSISGHKNENQARKVAGGFRELSSNRFTAEKPLCRKSARSVQPFRYNTSLQRTLDTGPQNIPRYTRCICVERWKETNVFLPPVDLVTAFKNRRVFKNSAEEVSAPDSPARNGAVVENTRLTMSSECTQFTEELYIHGDRVEQPAEWPTYIRTCQGDQSLAGGVGQQAETGRHQFHNCRYRAVNVHVTTADNGCCRPALFFQRDNSRGTAHLPQPTFWPLASPAPHRFHLPT